MEVHLKIRRYAGTKEDPCFQDFKLNMESTDRLLDALIWIKDHQDSTLSFRKSCMHGVCGSDGMKINGINGLACKILLKNVKMPAVIEPLPGFRVIRDMIVDMDAFFKKFESVSPYLINHQETPKKERIQSQEEHAVFQDTTKCILCACCTSSCPSFWQNSEYVGPAAIVQAHRFMFDSRDTDQELRQNVLGDKTGVWRCRTIFNCVDACPRDINITKAIGEVKEKLLLDHF